MKKEIKVNVGEKYELSTKQDFWKDENSGVFLRAPGKVRVSRPKDVDYKTQLQWFLSKRFNKDKEYMFKMDSGNSYFEITKDMDTSTIKKAIENGILVPYGTNKELQPKIEHDKVFTSDPISGALVYNGPNKKVWNALQMVNEKKLIDLIEKLTDANILEIMIDMEQRGWNPLSSPRGNIMDALRKQFDINSNGLTSITENPEEQINIMKEDILKEKVKNKKEK